MAVSLSSISSTMICSTKSKDSVSYNCNWINTRSRNGSCSNQFRKTKHRSVFINCKSEEESTSKKLGIGSPVIVIEAPLFIKTAASVPCLRANSGLVKPGDVGRIMSRKPKDVWAVRLNIGTYLLDGKYFKPLDLD